MKIAIFGTGYVGLVTGTCLAEAGHDVLCMDIDEQKITNLQCGIIPIYEPGLSELVERNITAGRLHFTTDPKEAVEYASVIFNAVGTPPDPSDHNKADLKYVRAVAKSFGTHLDGYKVFVNKSTVPVGTADMVKGVIQAELDSRWVNHTFDVVSNPEFLREGAAVKDFQNPDRIVCGVETDAARDLMDKVYQPIARTYRGVMFTDPKSAELIKYASNAFLATKISFINEIANFAEIVGANITDVARGMGADKRIGPKFLHAGIGYGGSCFPKDVKALIATGEEVGYSFNIIKATEDVNARQKTIVVDKLLKHMDSLSNKTIALRGLAFKPRTDDIREAPALDVVQRLLDNGAKKLKLFDPIATQNFLKEFPPSNQIEYVDNPYDAANNADALIILTERDVFRGTDLAHLKDVMKGNLIIDGRNIRDMYEPAEYEFVYEGVGK